MSSVTKMERIETPVMDPLYEGGYQYAIAKKYAWMCDGCRLVWPMRNQAYDCEARAHVDYYEAEYPGGYDQVTGKPLPRITYPRHAIRREPAPEADYSVRHKGYLFHVVGDPQKEAERAHAARTAHDDWVINATGRCFKARIGGQVVWSYTADGLPHSIYLTHEQAEALGIPKP